MQLTVSQDERAARAVCSERGLERNLLGEYGAACDCGHWSGAARSLQRHDNDPANALGQAGHRSGRQRQAPYELHTGAILLLENVCSNAGFEGDVRHGQPRRAFRHLCR
jgi:hypothetical protein